MRVLVLLAAVSAWSCAPGLQRLGAQLDHVRRDLRAIECYDGAPAKLLIDVRCADGVCGVTCAPDRWLPTPPRPQ